MLAFFLKMVVISAILLPNYFIIESPFRVTSVLLSLSIATYLVDNQVILKRKPRIARDTRNIIIVSIILLSYVFFSDFFKNDAAEGARQFISVLMVPLILPIFEFKGDRMTTEKIMFLAFAISVLLAVLQIFGFRHNLNTLFPGFSIVRSDELSQLVDPMLGKDLRVSGAVQSIIGFSEYLAIFIIIAYYRFFEKKSVFLLVIISVLIAVLFFTKTRSAIYGLLPSIVMVKLIYGKRNAREILKALVFTGLIILVAANFSSIIEKMFFGLKNPLLDASVIERLQTNYYATIGVLREAPVFGISKEIAEDVIRGAIAEEGLVFGDIIRASTTHHNQILYYFRYYGLVGVGVLLVLYYLIFKKIAGVQDRASKMMLMSVFIFDFQFSMAHNTKLINNVLLWILLSFAAKRRSLREQMDRHSSLASVGRLSKRGAVLGSKTNSQTGVTHA